MIRELEVLAALGDVEEIKRANPPESNSAAYIAELEFRLQTISARVSALVKQLARTQRPSAAELNQVVNRLESSLRQLDRKEATKYLYTFNQQFFEQSQFHPDMAEAIKRVLVRYCEQNETAPLYPFWSE